jgi:hypothetical protein
VRSKISVVGSSELARLLTERDYADVVQAAAGEDLAGSSVVVLAAPGDELFEDIRRRAPAAVVVVAGHSPQPVCEATLFPRARIIGVDDVSIVGDVVDSLVLGRERVFNCTVRLEGERGIDGEFAAAPVRLGCGGIQEIIEEG